MRKIRWECEICNSKNW